MSSLAGVDGGAKYRWVEFMAGNRIAIGEEFVANVPLELSYVFYEDEDYLRIYFNTALHY